MPSQSAAKELIGGYTRANLTLALVGEIGKTPKAAYLALLKRI
jgi:hypothetical protein